MAFITFTVANSHDVIVLPETVTRGVACNATWYAYLEGGPSIPAYEKYGTLDFCVASDSNGSNAFQVDFATWYAYGVARETHIEKTNQSYLVLRFWPSANAIGKLVSMGLDVAYV
jgi:hypothetical protein